jgi:hypothetical protein
VTAATAIEGAGIIAVLFACAGPLHMVGAIAASIAILTGRMAANLYLHRETRRL